MSVLSIRRYECFSQRRWREYMWWFSSGWENWGLRFLLSAHFREHHSWKCLVTHLTLCLLIFSCNIDIQAMVSKSQMVSRAENPQDIHIILFTLAVWKWCWMQFTSLYFPSKLGGKKLNKNQKPKQKRLVPLQPQVLNLSFWNAVSTALHSQAHYFYWPRLSGWCWQVNLQ